MTERDQSTTRRDAAERRELEAAGWEPKGHGVKTIWQSPADGRWYAHYQALAMRPPHSLLQGVSSHVLHSSAFVGFVTGCKH
jgi:hypothetical protein